MDDLFEEDKKRKSAEKNEVDWTDVCILHEIGFICFQETKVPKIPLETEIFKYWIFGHPLPVFNFLNNQIKSI